MELFWQTDLGYIGQAILGVKLPNSSHVASTQHRRVKWFEPPEDYTGYYSSVLFIRERFIERDATLSMAAILWPLLPPTQSPLPRGVHTQSN